MRAAFALVAVALSACQPNQRATTTDSNLDSDTAAIRSEAQAWFKAIAEKDLEKTLSFYASDAQYLSAGRPAAITPEARRKLWVEDYATPGFSSDETTTRIEVARSKDLAYQSGAYHSATSSGKFVVIWQKQNDGQWKAIVDIDNADQ